MQESALSHVYDGDREGASRFLFVNSGQLYVYALCRPDGRPFYIGKGVKRRVFEHELEAQRHHPAGEANPFKCNVIRKILRDGKSIRYRIIALYNPDEQLLCLRNEAGLIRKYGRLHEGGILTNLASGLGNYTEPSPFSRARHAATLSGEPENNPQRLILNRFLQSIGPVKSVPIKPADQLSRILPTTPHPQPRQPTKRSAYALIASAAATGMLLVEGVRLARTFYYEGIEACIENGVARDLVKAGMATLFPNSSPKAEAFSLSEAQIAILISLVGREHLISRGLL